jgi:hypothetical protein
VFNLKQDITIIVPELIAGDKCSIICQLSAIEKLEKYLLTNNYRQNMYMVEHKLDRKFQIIL